MRPGRANPGTPEESFDELERDAHAGRTVKFDLRCSADEKLRWAEAASTLGLSVSEFVRDVANQAADEVLAGGPVAAS